MIVYFENYKKLIMQLKGKHFEVKSVYNKNNDKGEINQHKVRNNTKNKNFV